MARKIVITSGKGGVGKTTVTACLGRALASLGERVVVIDGDIGLNNLDVLLGIDKRVVFDVIDVIEGRCRLRQALIEDVEEKNLFVLPSAHSYDSSKFCGQNMKEIVLRLSHMFDYVLVDCPAGIESGFKRSVASCDEAIIVTTPHISALKDAETVMNILRTNGITNEFIVVNRVRGDLIASGESLTKIDVEKILNNDVYAMIPEEDDLNFLSNATSSGYSCGYAACIALARGLRSGVPELYDFSEKYRGIFGKIRRRLKRKL